MKYITVDIPGEFPTVVLFSPSMTHDKMAKLLGNPKVIGAGFAVIPPEERPRAVGHSTSLNLGPAAIDGTLIDAGFKITAKQYPYEPLLDGITPR